MFFRNITFSSVRVAWIIADLAHFEEDVQDRVLPLFAVGSIIIPLDSSGTSPELVHLQSLRETLYSAVFVHQQDALLELLEALLDLMSASSFVELCLSPFFRQEWPSVYVAVDHGRVDSETQRGLVLVL